MKKMRHSRLLVFVLVAVLFAAAAVPAYAALTSRDITVFGGVRIFVDGKELRPIDVKGNDVDAFIYEGTTYVPLRAVGEALGAEVRWNSESKTVYVNTEKTGEAPEQHIARFDAGSGDFTYTCGPMHLSSRYCTAEVDGFTIVYSEVAFGDPTKLENVRLYELHALIQGTVKESQQDYFLCYAHCYDKNGKLLVIEKIVSEVEVNVPFKRWYTFDIPVETASIVVMSDRMDLEDD